MQKYTKYDFDAYCKDLQSYYDKICITVEDAKYFIKYWNIYILQRGYITVYNIKEILGEINDGIFMDTAYGYTKGINLMDYFGEPFKQVNNVYIPLKLPKPEPL